MRTALSILLALTLGPAGQPLPLPEPRLVAEGVRLYGLDSTELTDPPALVSVRLLRLDPRVVELTADLALGDRQGRSTVQAAAERRAAIAAVNAGFFDLATGDPTGVLRIDGLLVSESRRARGVAAIAPRRDGRQAVLTDRVRVAVQLEMHRPRRSLRIDAIDTARGPGKLMLYTPRYGAGTGTAGNSVEWILRRTAGGYAVVSRVDHGSSAIPRDGAVLSFGGRTPPPALDRLRPGDVVRVREAWVTAAGEAAPDGWRTADDLVGGAGLLVRRGRAVADWTPEGLTPSFLGRHPRTMIGQDAAGEIWLVTVDGRQPGVSAGMTLRELQQLALRLGLVEALNLDGGGSTTMVVRGAVVNRPSDPGGARPVSDVLLVLPLPAPPPAGRH